MKMMTNDIAIEQINNLLKEAGEKQVELNPEIESAEEHVKDLKYALAGANKELKKLEAFAEAPRAGAKALAKDYLLSGGDSDALPAQIKSRATSSFDYDEAEMVLYLANSGNLHLLTVNKAHLTTFLKQQGTGNTPAITRTGISIACDTDLTGLA